MNAEMQFSIPAGHPALQGHFPDNPIVPGALLLDEVTQRIETYNYIISAKFMAPVLPNQICFIEEMGRTDTRLKLAISVSGVTVMKMVVALQ